jgi:type IV secretion system protein TrbI
MDDNMKPEDSPKVQVKKASKVPIFIALVICVVVVSAIAYGAWKRADDQKKKKELKLTNVEKPINSKATIESLMNSYIKKEDENKKVEEKKKEEVKVETNARKQLTPEEQMREKLKQKRMELYSSAIMSETGIKGDWHSKDSKSQSLEVKDKPKVDKWALGNAVEAPTSPYMVRAGGVIPAVMISGVNSDLPGKLIAQVSENIYDTATHKHLLIPQGTRLFGEYDSEIEFGQERVLEAWNRLTFPDGKALDIGDMPGTDAAGYSGFQDQVNHHYMRIYGNALLMSAVLGGVALTQNQGQGSTQGAYGQNSNSILSQSLGQQLGQATTRILQKNINIKPTIEVRPGYTFNVMVVKDITFDGEYQSFDY